MSRTFDIQAAGATHTGRRRVTNEDSFAVRLDLGLFMVADGVATCADGALASATALEQVAVFFADSTATWPADATGEAEDPGARFVAAVKHANQYVHRLAARGPRGRGMATTFAGILAEADGVRVVHAGDSRVYRLRAGKVDALTMDHNFANELILRGMPTEIAESRPDAYALTRVLGMADRVDPSTRQEAARAGDVVLVCHRRARRVPLSAGSPGTGSHRFGGAL